MENKEEQTFSVGDIVKIKDPEYKSVNYPISITNTITGEKEKLETYEILGVIGVHPFAKFLVKKKFVCTGTKDYNRTQSFQLLNNYKPGLLGTGYRLNVKNTEILEKTGRIIDLRKLPRRALNTVHLSDKHKRLIESLSRHYRTRGMSILDLITFSRRNIPDIRHEDPGIRYALLFIYKHMYAECRYCCHSLTKNIDVIHIDMFILSLINKKVTEVFNKDFIGNIEYIFPMGYICKNCGHLNVFVCLSVPHQGGHSIDYECVCIGHSSELVKANE
jgi:hypothetical protein